jgi:hypothetical protein
MNNVSTASQNPPEAGLTASNSPPESFRIPTSAETIDYHLTSMLDKVNSKYAKIIGIRWPYYYNMIFMRINKV